MALLFLLDHHAVARDDVWGGEGRCAETLDFEITRRGKDSIVGLDCFALLAMTIQEEYALRAMTIEVVRALCPVLTY